MRRRRTDIGGALPYWRHELSNGTATFVFDGEQALALAAELQVLLAGTTTYSVRVDQLAHRLTFDGDFLRSTSELQR